MKRIKKKERREWKGWDGGKEGTVTKGSCRMIGDVTIMHKKDGRGKRQGWGRNANGEEKEKYEKRRKRSR